MQQASPISDKKESSLVEHNTVQQKPESGAYLKDLRLEATKQKGLAESLSNRVTGLPIQKKANTTGLADQLKSDVIQGSIFQLAKIDGAKFVDNKDRSEVITLPSVFKFDGFDEAGAAKTLKVSVKGTGVVNWYKLYNKGGAESDKIMSAVLPKFYLRQHDVPGYLPKWGYDSTPAESEKDTYGKVKIISFKTPSGAETVDVEIMNKNKIKVDRRFFIDAVIDESGIKAGYRVEYRQYIKGFFKYMGNLNPHTLYKGVPLSNSYNEDGNGGATPYGRRDIGGGGVYNTGNPAAITYHAEDKPGMLLSKDENGEIDLSFIGKLVVVTTESDVPIAELVERSWSFKGKVNNRGGGLFNIS